MERDADRQIDTISHYINNSKTNLRTHNVKCSMVNIILPDCPSRICTGMATSPSVGFFIKIRIVSPSKARCVHLRYAARFSSVVAASAELVSEAAIANIGSVGAACPDVDPEWSI